MATDVIARLAIINPIAVADAEARLGTVSSDCVLDKPWKRLRKARIELPGIDLLATTTWSGTVATPLASWLFAAGTVQHLASGRVTLRRRQVWIVGVSCRSTAEEGRTIGNVQPCADPQAFHEVGIGNVEPAEADEIRQIATTRLKGEPQVIAVIGDIAPLERPPQNLEVEPTWHFAGPGSVSYTHLTLPTIYSV